MLKTAVLLLSLFLSHLAISSELVGAWELVSGEYVNKKNELVGYQSFELKALKVLSVDHFSFTSEKSGEFWAGVWHRHLSS